MLLAVPAIMLIAASTVAAFKSGIFNSAIFLTCSFVNLPTLVLFGTPEPLSNPNSYFIRTAAGGVFKIKLKDLSW